MVIKNLILLLLLTSLMLSCGRPKGIGGSQNSFLGLPNYSEIDAKIFQPKCLKCHDSGSVNFSSYNSLMAGTSVIPEKPEDSSLYQEVSSGRMPKNSVPLSDVDVKAIYDWIKAGAL